MAASLWRRREAEDRLGQAGREDEGDGSGRWRGSSAGSRPDAASPAEVKLVEKIQDTVGQAGQPRRLHQKLEWLIADRAFARHLLCWRLKRRGIEPIISVEPPVMTGMDKGSCASSGRRL